MVQLKSLVALLSAAATLPIGSFARECYVVGTAKAPFHSLLVETYGQLNQFRGCTTLIGSLDIGPTFSGDFSLRGVKNITGAISAFGAVDEIHLPDLEFISSVILFERCRVKRLLLPRVTRVEGLHISQPRGFFFDFGALESADAILFDGPWSRISFPSLESVDSKLSFVTQLPWATKGYPRDPAPIDIELPALRRVGGLTLEGDIRSLSTPRLDAIGDGGLRVSAQQADLAAVDLPSLKSLKTRLSLWGRISRVELGQLQKTDASMYINTNVPVEIHSEVYRAGDISIYGELKTLNLSHLLDAESMTIESNIPTECSSYVVWTYRYLNRPREAEFCGEESLFRAGRNTWPDRYRPTPSYEPTPTPTPEPHTPMRTRTPSPSPGASPKAGIGSGAEVLIVAVFGVILGGSIVWFWMNRRKGSIELEEQFEEESGLPLLKDDMEAEEEEEMGRLLHGEFEGENLDAPPPYAKHLRG